MSPNGTILRHPAQHQSSAVRSVVGTSQHRQYVSHPFRPWAVGLRMPRLPERAAFAGALTGAAFPMGGQTLEGEREAVLRRPRIALPDCKFATLNQLFGGDKVARPNWSGVRLRFVDMVGAIASAETREAVAGRLLAWRCLGCQTSGWDSGGGDLLNEARA